MEYSIIEVPDMNDSVSRVVLNGVAYHIRFTYNDTGNYWKFGLYTTLGEPVVIGIKIVPRFPLNVFYGITKIPDGIFGVMTNLDRVGRDDFKNGKAKFVFCPVEIEKR